MNRKVIFIGFALVAVILLVGAVVGVPLAQASASKAVTGSIANVSAARWQALGESYSQRSAPSLAVANVSAARWQALGESYILRGTSSQSAADVSAARWQALGESFLMRQSSLP
jgi:hypothetical protein